MITIFNRRELTITFSMEQQSKIRSLLDSHDIPYRVKIRDMIRRRNGWGTFGVNMAASLEYIFYVHKDDYETAHEIIYGNNV